MEADTCTPRWCRTQWCSLLSSYCKLSIQTLESEQGHRSQLRERRENRPVYMCWYLHAVMNKNRTFKVIGLSSAVIYLSLTCFTSELVYFHTFHWFCIGLHTVALWCWFTPCSIGLAHSRTGSSQDVPVKSSQFRL